MMLQENWTRVAAIAAVSCMGAQTALGNLVVNGDFQTGSLFPSTTSYANGGESMFNPGTWNIVSYDTFHGGWSDFYDHTLGNEDGRYMVVNGTTLPGGPAWSQTISVAANTDYEMSAWFASITVPVAALQFRVVRDSGTIASQTFVTPGATTEWGFYSYAFNSGSSTTVTVQIWDVSGLYMANDYAIDDIAVTVVSAPAAGVALALGGLRARGRRRT
jgi:hypothetical protein